MFAFDLKTTAILTKKYLEAWRYDSQTIVHCLAVEHRFGRPCLAVQMEFLYKGYKRQDSSNPTGHALHSPLIRGYISAITGRIEHDPKFGKVKGFAPIDPWVHTTMAEWLRQLPQEVVAQQFSGRAVYRSEWETTRWKQQTAIREWDIENVLVLLNEAESPTLENAYFPGNFDSSCFDGKYGHNECEYLKVCYDPLTPEEALASGEYVRREPHYQKERDERKILEES